MDDKEKVMKMKEDINEQVVDKINSILNDGVKQTNVDYLGKLVDIHKDLANEDYWENKEDKEMRYKNYGRHDYTDNSRMSYGRRRRDSRGRYMGERTSGEYGRRPNVMDEMFDYYGNYMEDKDQYRRGNYGAKDDSIESLECMMEAIVDFVETLKEEADSDEEIKIIQRYSKKISDI